MMDISSGQGSLERREGMKTYGKVHQLNKIGGNGMKGKAGQKATEEIKLYHNRIYITC